MEKIKLSVNNPSAETVVEAARKAIVEDKIYDFKIVDSEGRFMMIVNGYRNGSDFANTEIRDRWKDLCECERPWDEFDTKYLSIWRNFTMMCWEKVKNAFRLKKITNK